MRKLFSAFLALTLVLVFSVTAFADVIWEPYDDSYYKKHQEDFTFCRSAYETLQDTPCLDKPGGKVIDTIAAGETFYGEYLCTAKDGDYIVSNWRINDKWVSVYILRDLVIDRYDQEFLTDFADQLQTEAPEGIQELFWEGPFRFWVYPGGPSRETGNYFEGDDFVTACQWFYTDPQGEVWGYIGYWYGHQDSWVCLTNMTEENLTGAREVLPASAAAPTLPQTPAETPAETSAIPTALLIALPTGVALMAAVLLIFLPKRKKEDKT